MAHTQLSSHSQQNMKATHINLYNDSSIMLYSTCTLVITTATTRLPTVCSTIADTTQVS